MEALTLPYEGDAFEVACNLLNWRETGPEEVLCLAQELSAKLGLEIVTSYTTSPTEIELIKLYNSLKN